MRADAPPPPALSESVDPAVFRALQRTRPWVLLMGSVGFVMVGLMLLVGVGAGIAGVATGDAEIAALIVVYPLIAVLYVFPSLYLVRYANRIRDFMARGQQSELQAALEAQRAFWKFIGIVTLVSFAFAVLLFVAAMIAGIAMAL